MTQKFLETYSGQTTQLFQNDEPIADKLFAWIKQNASDIRADA